MKSIVAGAFASMLMLPVAARAQEANSVYIDQIGDASKVTIAQEGNRNRIGDSTAARAVLGGLNGSATITQKGDDNVMSRSVTVKEAGNHLVVLQQGNRNSYNWGRITGAYNKMELTQKGSDNRASTSINGQDNVLSIAQEGRENYLNFSSAGSENRVSLLTQGDRNRTEITSNGSRNQISTAQVGTGHAIMVNQTGSGAMLSITQR
jgi:hypothetical protein